MGRRRDDPALQAAKGYPGRRKKATDQQIEAAAAAAEAEVVAVDPFAVPSVFTRAPAYYKRAIELWRTQAQTLQAGGRRRPGYRGALTRYCMWTQIHESAMDQLRRSASTVRRPSSTATSATSPDPSVIGPGPDGPGPPSRALHGGALRKEAP